MYIHASIMFNVIGDDDSDRVAKTQVQTPKNKLQKQKEFSFSIEVGTTTIH